MERVGRGAGASRPGDDHAANIAKQLQPPGGESQDHGCAQKDGYRGAVESNLGNQRPRLLVVEERREEARELCDEGGVITGPS